MDRIRLIEHSLRCYSAGWWSLIPLLGLLAGPVALYHDFAAGRRQGDEWNPAQFERSWGRRLALLGLLLSIALVGCLVVERMNRS